MKACWLRSSATWLTLAIMSRDLMPGVRGSQGEDSAAQVLVEQFNNTAVFWRQFEIAKKIVALQDTLALPQLERWLTHEDRHLRGNAAFIFASLGDNRGFVTIREILEDRSDRPQGQGVPGVAGDGRFRVVQQISADRYYAAHLFGDLKDPRAVPILVPLMNDEEVGHIVPWSLGEIGDRRAIAPLIKQLGSAPNL